MDIGKVVIVGGSIRSGTTMIQRILCASPDVNPIVAEINYLDNELSNFEFWRRDFALHLRDHFGTVERLEAFVQGIARDYFATIREQTGGPEVLILKSPFITTRFPLLARWFPAMKFLVVVRDPRDIVASIIDVGERHAERNARSPLVRMGRDMDQLCRYTRTFYVSALRAMDTFKQRIKTVKYEAVVRNPEAAIPALAAFAGVSLASEAVDDADAWNAGTLFMDAGARERNAVGAGFWSPLYTEAISTARIGRHREMLTGDEIAKIESHFADFNKAYRYW